MNVFFDEETGANQFDLTYTFQNTPAPDPSMLPVLYWLSYFSASMDTVQLFFQHPDADAQHRLTIRDDTISGATTQTYSLDCGKGGRIVPRGATGFLAAATQLSNGVPWSLRLVTTGKTGDAFIDFGWGWERVL